MIEELNMIYDELTSSNVKKIEHFETELSKIRAGKASPSMLSGVMVEYYEAMTPLQQVANVSVMDARTLIVSLGKNRYLTISQRVLSMLI